MWCRNPDKFPCFSTISTWTLGCSPRDQWFRPAPYYGVSSSLALHTTKQNKYKTLFRKNISPRLFISCLCIQAVFVWFIIIPFNLKCRTYMGYGLGHELVPMMTSPNGNIFRVTGPLCGEFTGHRWIPSTKVSDAELWWSETPSWSLWRHCNAMVPDHDVSANGVVNFHTI